MSKPIEHIAHFANEENEWLEAASYRERNAAWLQVSAEITNHVLELLHEKNWSQAELARQLNVSPQQVSKLLSGQANLRLSTIAKLQEVLGVKLITTRFAYPWKEHLLPEFESAGLIGPYTRELPTIQLALMGSIRQHTSFLNSYVSYHIAAGIEKKQIILFQDKIHSTRAKSNESKLSHSRHNG